jgi:hypothetical protein
MVSSAGGKKGFVYKDRQDVYRALRRHGKSKKLAAQIANEGHTAAGRKAMAKKAATTREAKGKK